MPKGPTIYGDSYDALIVAEQEARVSGHFTAVIENTFGGVVGYTTHAYDVAPEPSTFRHHGIVAWSVPECRWFAGCENPAGGTVTHPVLGEVPTCPACVERLGLAFTMTGGALVAEHTGRQEA